MSLASQMKLEDEISTFELKITSMTQTTSGTQVNATGTVGRYGKVWLSYDFTLIQNKSIWVLSLV